jgi:hypothetical protein
MSKHPQTFPSVVHTLDELPLAVREIVQQHHSDSPDGQIIKIPPQESSPHRTFQRFEPPFTWHRAPERYLVFGERQITIIERETDGHLHTSAIPLTALVDIHLTLALLYAFVEFMWITGSHLEQKKIEFNAVGHRLFERNICRMRTKLNTNAVFLPDINLAVSSNDFPLKFHNYLYDSLLPSEHYRAVIYQPALRQGSKWLGSYLSPNRAIGLTGSWIVIVEDALHRIHFRYGGVAEYATVRHFYPSDHLQTVTFETRGELEWLKLRIGTDAANFESPLPLLPPNADVLRAAFEDLPPTAVHTHSEHGVIG